MPDSAGVRLVVVDTTYYLFRSFHAIRDLRTRDGVPTNALYGLANTLVALRERYADAALACVIDAPGTNFRHEMYPQYKATRKKPIRICSPRLIRPKKWLTRWACLCTA